MSTYPGDTIGDPIPEAAANGLAYLCSHLDEISTLLKRDIRGRKALRHLQSGPLTAGDVSEALNVIHKALLRAGDALGIYGHVRGPRDISLAGVSGEPLEIVYRCPAQRCLRVVPGPALRPPQCGITGQPLNRGRL